MRPGCATRKLLSLWWEGQLPKRSSPQETRGVLSCLRNQFMHPELFPKHFCSSSWIPPVLFSIMFYIHKIIFKARLSVTLSSTGTDFCCVIAMLMVIYVLWGRSGNRDMFLKTLMHHITIVVQTKAYLELDTKRLLVGKRFHGFKISSRL